MKQLYLQPTIDTINKTILSIKKPLHFHQQPKTPQNMAVGYYKPKSGTLWIRPCSKGELYDIALSGYELDVALRSTFIKLFGPIHGYKAQFERTPFWKVNSLHDVQTAIVTYASTLL